MPTYNVGSGQTYANITAALAAIPLDLSGGGVQEIDVLNGTDLTEDITVGGFSNASVTDYIHITSSTGRFILRTSSAGTYGVYINTDYVLLDKVDLIPVDAHTIAYLGRDNCVIDNFTIDSQSFYCNAIIGDGTRVGTKASNGSIVGSINNGARFVKQLETISVVGSDYGLRNADSATDCASFDTNFADDFSSVTTVTNCASSDTSGSVGLQNLTATNEFTDPAGGDLTLLVTSTLIGAGSTGNNVGWDQVTGGVNQVPVADDETYSIQDDVSNGTVVGTFTATDSDGTIASYSITGTTLAIDNAGQITIADNTGITAGVDITATVTATDDDGATDTALITVNVTATVLTADSITAGLLREGDTVTIQLSNATNVAGKTLSCAAGTITPTAQDINSISFSVFDLKSFGTKTLNYNENIPVTVTDAGESDTINFQISPDVGSDFAVITAVEGIYTDDVTVAIGDHGYGTFLTGTGSVHIPTGNFSPDVHATYEYWVRDATDGVWSDSVVETFQDPTGTYVTVTTPVDETDGSVFYGYTGNTPQNTDTIIHDPVTVPSGIGVTVLPSGIWQLASMPTEDQTFQAYVLHADNTYGEKATFTFTAPIEQPDTTPPVITLLGTSPVSINEGSVYNDAGATALDNIDGDITADIVTVNPVNTSVPSTYTVTYNVSDAAGNAATEVTRTVNVIALGDTTPPVITLIGSSTVNIVEGSVYNDAGATATDDTDGDLTGSIVTVNPVNTSVPSTYTVTYNVSDAAGNPAVEVTRTVTVTAASDTTPPVLTNPVATVTGSTTVTLSIDTDEGNGTGYYYISTNSSETFNTVETNGVSSTVNNSGTLTYNVTGLTAETSYYAHFAQSDLAGNNSGVVTSSVFTTTALLSPAIANIDGDNDVYPGQVVNINGTNFGNTEGTVTLGSVSQIVQNWSDTVITIEVVKGAMDYGSGHQLVVTLP